MSESEILPLSEMTSQGVFITVSIMTSAPSARFLPLNEALERVMSTMLGDKLSSGSVAIGIGDAIKTGLSTRFFHHLPTFEATRTD